MQFPFHSDGLRLWADDLAIARAQQLGLPGTVPLMRAVEFGAAAARSVTVHHPKAYRGYRMWAETVAALRAELMSANWASEDLANIPLVVHRAEPLIVITTAPGESYTGSAGHREGPRLRYTKGEFSTRFYNGEYDDLWARALGSDYEVWFLVHQLHGHVVKSELSKPSNLDDSGQVTGWDERILLPDLGFGPDPTRMREPVRPDVPTITPEVRRRDAS